MDNLLKKANTWLSDTFDLETKNQVQKLIKDGKEELTESFYKELEFGTGGMRGIMGVGTNRINKYTLGKATQGLSNYINLTNNTPSKVVIAYDCRHNSKEFAQIVADIFTANGIKVFLFSDLRPTPELSFAVSTLGCQAGIVLTASHNPPEYNGYKVYWEDGGQIVPPHDSGIIDEIQKVDFKDIKFKSNKELLEIIDIEIDEKFIKASIDNGTFNATNRDNLKIVFTSLHGTAIKGIPQVLDEAGYNNIYIVDEQAEPNGNFPTVKSPNPEEKEALEMAINLANEVEADIVIGTDPDADRIGIAVRDNNGDLVILNGNQTMAVMIDFLLEQAQKNKTLKGNEFVATTIVSTPLISEIAASYNVETKTCLTGFKWIAKMIKDFPNKKYIGGGEESYGFMVGDFLRDKDAVTSALLACEIATIAKEKGSSLYQELQKIYSRFGLYLEDLTSITKKGMKGAKEIEQMMVNFRNNPIKEIDGEKVEFFTDYLTSKEINCITKEQYSIDLPKSNVLIFQTENGTKVACRPSGTEPKIKFYISVNSKLLTKKELSEKIERIQEQIFN